MRAHSAAGAVLSAWRGSSGSLVQTLPGDRDHRYPQFAGEDTEAQSHLLTGTQLGSGGAGTSLGRLLLLVGCLPSPCPALSAEAC